MFTVSVMGTIMQESPAKYGVFFVMNLSIGILYTHMLNVTAGQVQHTLIVLSFINP